MDNDGVVIPEVVGEGWDETNAPSRPAMHRWSGWPGAWCLDCGQEDQNEFCIAVHTDGLICMEGHVQCEEHPLRGCNEHVNGPCLAPGQMLADPYAMNDARRKLLGALSLRTLSTPRECQ